MGDSTNIIAIGELLWDVFPDQQRLGGAPANFAIHCAQLSGNEHEVALVSAVGDDELGTAALAAINNTRVNSELVSTVAHPTGQVRVTIDGNGSPSYEIAADVAWDYLPGSDGLAKAASAAHAICFGTLAQRCPVSRDVIQQTVAATSESCLRVLDINVRPTMNDPQVFLQSLEIANVLKLSDEELPALAEQFGLAGDLESQLGELQQRFELTAIAYTRGEHGAILLRGEDISRCPGIPTNVVDTVGAGDAFTAALVLGLLEKRTLDEINYRACRIAAFICSQNGATPKVPASVLA
jgi:fructokinase